MSITKSDAAYIAMGQWTKTPRTEITEVGTKAEGGKKYSNCRPVGDDVVSAVATTVYEYSWQIDGGAAKTARVWIGRDGLLHKQEAGRGFARYEYEDVKAPD